MSIRRKFVICTLAVSVFTASAAGTTVLASDDGNKKNASPAEPSVSVVMPEKPERAEAVKHCPSLSYGLEVIKRGRKLRKTAVNGNVTFSVSDFAQFGADGVVNSLTITGLPDPGEGTLKLGALDAFEGQRIPAALIDRLTFAPAYRGAEASFSFSVNDGDSVECLLNCPGYQPAEPAISSGAVYPKQNVRAFGALTVSAASEVTFSVQKQPSHGLLRLSADGSFTYTPEDGFIGRDSFVCAATDKYGASCDPLTVTVKVERNDSPVRYSDVKNTAAEYPAYLLAERGILVGQTVADVCTFEPDEPVSRGDFIVMAMKAAGYAPNVYGAGLTSGADAAGRSASGRGYVVTAISAGVISAEERDGGLYLRPADIMTVGEAETLVAALTGKTASSESAEPLDRAGAAILLGSLIDARR